MKAAVLRDYNEPLSIEDIEIADPKVGEVKVRFFASGVCNSDLARIEGKRLSSLPIVLGHEASGTVVEVGPGVTNLLPGDHVVLQLLYHCGECDFCKMNKPNQCEVGMRMLKDGTLADGTTRLNKGNETIYHMVISSFGEYGVVPQECAIKIPKDIPLDQAALLGCGVLTGTGAVFNTAKVEQDSTVLIIGAGGVGLNAVQASVVSGASKIIVADLSKEKLNLASEFGATHLIDASNSDTIAEVKKLTGGLGADYAFEVIGNPKTIQQAYESTRNGGKTVVVGLGHHKDVIEINTVSIPFQEKILTGSFYGGLRGKSDIDRLVTLYKQDKLNLRSLITKEYELEEVNEVFKDMKEGKLARGLIVYN